MIGVLKIGLPKKRFTRLADFTVGDAEWPLGGPPVGATTLADLEATDHLIVDFRSKTLFADYRGLQCRVSALMFEPPAIHRRYYQLIPFFANRYHRVLTHNSGLLTKLPNARFLPHGGCWLDEVPSGSAADKTGGVAMIASNKRYTVGHKLRHRIGEWARREAVALDLLGKGFQPLADKADGHAPYRHSVVIENSREPGYFTEKLIDSLLCSSLPIYWGAPDVAHFFDPRGMIICNTEQQVRDAILAADESDYQRRLPYLIENRRRAVGFADRLLNAAKILQREDEMNGEALKLLSEAA